MKKYIKINLLEFIAENVTVKTYDDSHGVRYETADRKAYADIAKLEVDRWHICLIESRRKGGGTELINKIISDAKECGVKKITLTTTELGGWGFFDKMGFVEVGDDNDPFDLPMIFHL